MRKNGFTIIELMIVMVVISILVGITLPRFKGMKDQANKSKAESELRTIQTAVESYYINTDPHQYPPTTSDIVGNYLVPAQPNIINIPFYDPFQDNETEYLYILSDNGQYYVIFSHGINRSADITGISDIGEIGGDKSSDIYITNGGVAE